MASRKRLYSLNFKLLLVLLGAALVSMAIWFGLQALGGAVIQRQYMRESARSQRMMMTAASFRNFVEENKVSSTGVEAIGRWNRENPYAQLTIWREDIIVTSNRYGADMVAVETGLVIRTGAGTDFSYRFPVVFSDGAYETEVSESSESHLYELLRIAGAGVSAVIFLLLMLLYSSYMIRNIQRLSKQVGLVSRGDLSREIRPNTRDEIGQLAEDVDAMRLSMIDKLRREERAWQANSQLITAISHDVRTPLTALMGYLEVLSQQENLTPEQQKTYLAICRNKAEKLRDLTGELFGYFLVFGRPEPEVHLEDFDARTLLEQLFGEHAEDLRQHGFRVELEPLLEPCGVRVDVGHLCRVFGNLFSNILKYADPALPVELRAALRDGQIRIRLSNGIHPAAGLVESTKIGLQTCEKLLEAMGGTFERQRDRARFTVILTLPALPV